jgi:hypothetical protein
MRPGDASTTAAVIRATVRAADEATGGTAVPRRHLRRAERRCERVTGSGPLAAVARRLDLLHRLGPGQRHLDVAVAALRRLPGAERDLALHATLTAALGAMPTTAGATVMHEGRPARAEGELAGPP